MKTGFTLIETVAVLLLVAILAMSTMVSLLPMTEALGQARANASAAQKARLAMARLSREFTTISNVAAAGAGSIRYDFLAPAGNWFVSHHHHLYWAGGDLMLRDEADGAVAPLCDEVGSFRLTYAPGPPPVIDVALTLSDALGGDSYSNRIVPRNIAGGGGGP